MQQTNLWHRKIRTCGLLVEAGAGTVWEEEGIREHFRMMSYTETGVYLLKLYKNFTSKEKKKTLL